MGVDFYQFGVPCQKSSSGPNIVLLHPEFRYWLYKALNDERLKGSAVYSGARAIAHQERLRRLNGCPDLYTSPPSKCRVPTAIPGRSLHNPRPKGFSWGNVVFEVPWAIAADISFAGRPSRVVDPIMSSYNMHRIKSETWHWQIDKNVRPLMVLAGQGSFGPKVTALQTALNKVLKAGLEADGIYGAKTAQAVVAFEKAQGLSPRGDWTKELQSRLENAQATPSPGVVVGRDADRIERQALRKIRDLATEALRAPND